MTPMTVRHLHLLHCLKRIVITGGEAFIDEEPSGPLWLTHTEICRLHDCPQHPFSCHRILLDKLSARVGHAAEVLRPRLVHHAIDNDVADLLRPELLRLWWKAQETVDFSLSQKLHRFGGWVNNPVDLFSGVKADIGCHAGKKDVVRGPELRDSHGLPLQIADSA